MSGTGIVLGHLAGTDRMGSRSGGMVEKRTLIFEKCTCHVLTGLFKNIPLVLRRVAAPHHSCMQTDQRRICGRVGRSLRRTISLLPGVRSMGSKGLDGRITRRLLTRIGVYLNLCSRTVRTTDTMVSRPRVTLVAGHFNSHRGRTNSIC